MLIKKRKFETHYFDIHARRHEALLKRCVLCGGETIVTVSSDKYDRWKAGEYIQNVWPEMSIDVRETLISGSHGACFDETFPPDQETEE